MRPHWVNEAAARDMCIRLLSAENGFDVATVDELVGNMIATMPSQRVPNRQCSCGHACDCASRVVLLYDVCNLHCIFDSDASSTLFFR